VHDPAMVLRYSNVSRMTPLNYPPKSKNNNVKWKGIGTSSSPLEQKRLPSSHQIFCSVPIIKLLRIMLKNRCWPTTFHHVTTEDVDGWCHKWLVWSTPQTWSWPRIQIWLQGSSICCNQQRDVVINKGMLMCIACTLNRQATSLNFYIQW